MAFTVTVDGSLTGAVNLLGLINTTNTTTITSTQVALATPVALDVGDIDLDGRNTTVVVSTVKGQGYIDVEPYNNGIPVRYRRIAVYEGVATPSSTFTISGSTTWDQLKSTIAAANNMVLGDIVIAIQETAAAPGTALIYDAYPPVDGGEGNSINTNVNAIADSFVYVVDASLAVTLEYLPTDAALHTVITTLNLDGFTPVV